MRLLCCANHTKRCLAFYRIAQPLANFAQLGHLPDREMCPATPDNSLRPASFRRMRATKYPPAVSFCRLLRYVLNALALASSQSNPKSLCDQASSKSPGIHFHHWIIGNLQSILTMGYSDSTQSFEERSSFYRVSGQRSIFGTTIEESTTNEQMTIEGHGAEAQDRLSSLPTPHTFGPGTAVYYCCNCGNGPQIIYSLYYSVFTIDTAKRDLPRTKQKAELFTKPIWQRQLGDVNPTSEEQEKLWNSAPTQIAFAKFASRRSTAHNRRARDMKDVRRNGIKQSGNYLRTCPHRLTQRFERGQGVRPAREAQCQDSSEYGMNRNFNMNSVKDVTNAS
ncbi:hypothetical protein GJ744_000969 [Endocarpon pusillum]|uniref:Uncharacterized protein n=1 Tax=Endocarpon pusillum TaxID=364733 RepID=A0A8H7E286_9EURO|nr:hypothetical protein GJ744_000969 [Endocarpon pusillum]